MVATSSTTGSTGVSTQTSSNGQASQPKASQAMIDSDSDHNSSSYGDDAPDSSPTTDFNPTHCLFCVSMSESIDMNLVHMSKSHGMTIPSPHQLTVDPTTLLEYLNLVVTVYHECLTCGTQRRNTQAIQQHMLGKGHCAFDISDIESEYREFWHFGNDGTGVEIDGDDVTLPSGKVVMSRSVRSTQHRQRSSKSGVTPLLSLSNASPMGASSSSIPRASDSPTTTASTFAQPAHNQALTRQDLRALNLDKQLGTLRTSDRLALAHLPASEQRATLVSQQKQLQKARRQERDGQARLQRKNNQTMMKHFVSDVPGPKLG